MSPMLPPETVFRRFFNVLWIAGAGEGSGPIKPMILLIIFNI
jgi:hypothetical protein